MYLNVPKNKERFTKPVKKWCRNCESTVKVKRAVKTCPVCGTKELFPAYEGRGE